MPIPKCPDAPALTGSDSKNIELTVQLVTPMFGGGVVAREVDETHPIRETSIRGQLQFWWRATAGAKYANSNELYNAHAEIWGSTKVASKVNIIINNYSMKPKKPCAVFNWNQNARQGKGAWKLDWQTPFNSPNSALPYALFPFQGEMPRPDRNSIPDVPPASFLQGSFKLTVKCPNSFSDSVIIAIKAWINFGGLGSRTRRGCGSLFSNDYSFKDVSSAKAWIGKHGTNNIRDWPTLSKTIYTHQNTETINSWNKSITLLKDFRQLPGFARQPIGSEGRPGRSYFPEPDTIRKLVTGNYQRHSPKESMPKGFPRAEFGLPIIFHFKPGDGDPVDTTLVPNIIDAERFASPLILKAIACSETEAFPSIILLNGERVQSCRLMLKNNSVSNSERVPIQSPSFKTIDPSPMNGHESAIDAFLAYACSEPQGYRPN
jgi:CRISPR-associated protein Cmr1